MRPTRVLGLIASLGTAFILSAPPSAGATAAGVGASDTATPNYLSSTTATVGTNEFRCTGGGCSMMIKTKTTAYPCTSELIALSNATTPGLLYQNTYCAVVISGYFEAPFGETSPTCESEAAQTLDVSFSSGVNSTFNGAFPATGTFKPTNVNATTHYITSGIITVKAGGQIQGNPTATGTVKASFQVQFPGAGLSPYCVSSLAGLTTISSGTVVTRF